MTVTDAPTRGIARARATVEIEAVGRGRSAEALLPRVGQREDVIAAAIETPIPIQKP